MKVVLDRGNTTVEEQVVAMYCFLEPVMHKREAIYIYDRFLEPEESLTQIAGGPTTF